MNLRLSGVSYTLPRITKVYYRLPRICDETLMSNYRVLRLKDSVSVRDYVSFAQDVKLKDSVVVWSQCLIADPPMEDAVDVQDSMQTFSRFRRQFDERNLTSDYVVFGVDKALGSVAIVGDKVSIHLEKSLGDSVSVLGVFDGYVTINRTASDHVAVGDRIRYDADSVITESTYIAGLLGIDTERDTFADNGGVSDGAAFGLDKKITDSASVTDSLSIELTRTTNSTYGQSVYGGSTFGG